MIKKLTIENFKKFQKVGLELNNFTLLMGENGCGKTSLLQAMALGLRALSTTDLITYDSKQGQVKFRRKGVPYTQLPGLYVEDPSDIFYAKKSRGGTGGGVTPIKIEMDADGGNIYRLEIHSLFGAYTVKTTSKQTDIKQPPRIIDYPPLFISGFVGILASEERFFPLAIEDRLTRGRASEILRNLLLDIYEIDPTRFDRLKTKIKENFNFELATVDFNRDKDLIIHANYNEILGKSHLALDLSTAGSGFLQILQILTPIYRYADRCSVVLLDEPDAHLHPNLQRTTARVLKEIAREENLQIIISTHSTAIIREVEPESVIPVTNERSFLPALSSGVEIESEIAFRLDNYTSGKASIAGKLIFVEDKHIKVLEQFDSLLKTGLFEGAKTIPVLKAQGKDDKVPFRIKDSLEKMVNQEIKIFFIRDGDGIPNEWRTKLETYATERLVTLYLLKYHELRATS